MFHLKNRAKIVIFVNTDKDCIENIVNFSIYSL